MTQEFSNNLGVLQYQHFRAYKQTYEYDIRLRRSPTKAGSLLMEINKTYYRTRSRAFSRTTHRRSTNTWLDVGAIEYIRKPRRRTR